MTDATNPTVGGDAMVESLVAREIEKAYREGWRDGYSAGCGDGSGDFDWSDPEGDWNKSEARAAITKATGADQ
jgi:hypothetical protein